MQRNPRRPLASLVPAHGGIGLGLPTTTSLPTRQWQRPKPTAYQVLPLSSVGDPQLTFGSSEPTTETPASSGPCEGCE